MQKNKQQKMRRAKLSLTLAGKEVTKDISPYVLSFSFSEKADSSADEISLSLADRDKLFQGDWMPSRGMKLVPKILYENWYQDDEYIELDCGEFEVDEVELETGDKDNIIIKALPSMVAKSIADQEKTRSWDGVSLETIASEIASEAELTLVYKASVINLGRVEQRGKSDLTFLQELSKKQGVRLKISSSTLILFEGTLADTSGAVQSLGRNALTSFRGRRKTSDVYSKVTISFRDTKTAKTINYEYAPSDAPETGKTLALNEEVKDRTHAERVAKARLREKNSTQLTGEINLMANPYIRAGGRVSILEHGVFSALYSVDSVTHEIGENAATTSASLKLALDY